MATEKLTPEQIAQASANLKVCQESIALKTEQAAIDAAKKATDIINKTNQQLARLPEDIIANINEAITTLMKLVFDWKDVSNQQVDPSEIITTLESLLNPVVDSLVNIMEALSLPDIPGLKQIKDLLAALKSALPMDKPEGWQGDWPVKGKRPELPDSFKTIITDLLAAVLALAVTLPLVIVNILANLIKVILDITIPDPVNVSLKSLALAVDPTGYVAQVPNVIALIPDMITLIPNMATKVKQAAEGKARLLVLNIQDLSIPSLPEAIEAPKSLPACPLRDK